MGRPVDRLAVGATIRSDTTWTTTFARGHCPTEHASVHVSKNLLETSHVGEPKSLWLEHKWLRMIIRRIIMVMVYGKDPPLRAAAGVSWAPPFFKSIHRSNRNQLIKRGHGKATFLKMPFWATCARESLHALQKEPDQWKQKLCAQENSTCWRLQQVEECAQENSTCWRLQQVEDSSAPGNSTRWAPP